MQHSEGCSPPLPSQPRPPPPPLFPSLFIHDYSSSKNSLSCLCSCSFSALWPGQLILLFYSPVPGLCWGLTMQKAQRCRPGHSSFQLDRETNDQMFAKPANYSPKNYSWVEVMQDSRSPMTFSHNKKERETYRQRLTYYRRSFLNCIHTYKCLNGVNLWQGDNTPTRHHILTKKIPVPGMSFIFLNYLPVESHRPQNITGYCHYSWLPSRVWW